MTEYLERQPQPHQKSSRKSLTAKFVERTGRPGRFRDGAVQIATRPITAAGIMGSDDFNEGVVDVRKGRPARFDLFGCDWHYERGRLWARIAPISMPLRIRGKLNRKALALLENAFDDGQIT